MPNPIQNPNYSPDLFQLNWYCKSLVCIQLCGVRILSKAFESTQTE
jgi:hypothetical protein